MGDLIRRHPAPRPQLPPRATPYGAGAGSVRRVSALRFRGPVLPDGEPRDLYVVDGRVTLEPQPGAETAAEGWIVPGLVDAHCHVGLDAHGAVDDATTEQQARDDRDAGALLLRDCGSPGRHPVGARARRPAAPGPLRPPSRPDPALHPRLRPRGRARRARRPRRPRGAVGRRLGEAGRRLDLPRHRRPRAVVPGRDVRDRDRRRPTSTAPGSPPTASARPCCPG